MLSAAKHLGASRAGPFAEFTLSRANVLRVTGRAHIKSNTPQPVILLPLVSS